MAMNNAFIFMVLACLLANATGTRDLPIKPGYKSVSSFQVSGDQAKCLNLLSGMNSCTSDIVDFFSDRLTNLGPSCCSSISTITKNCLPSTLASFGFTSELHNKLQEHCHAMSSLATAPIAGSEAPLANY
ncbi:egg cell-secreted protein 1.2-like [Quercus robur]|uniref:egg cell-secreted protein 1.2-like n=1 Tax=Quercus robur TaxID=38942 RepID=UPI002163DD72|nr:egg cell-secreted protein 1.2-like [Quercus robur]